MTALSRRAVLGGGLVIGLVLPMGMGRALAQGAPAPVDPNAFIRIAADDSVTVLCKHIEFGQGPWTGLPTIVAEELDADWSQMRAAAAPADVRLYANGLLGVQGTGGSSAIANSYDQLRRAGAMARAMLVAAAAQAWGVPASEITVSKGVIAHPASGRKSGFGAFADAAAKLPAPADVTLKDPAKFTLIGRDQKGFKVDSRAKTDGTAKFSIDQTAPNMLTVVVAHPPRFGAKVASFDASKALAVRGVVAVKQIGSGVAVFAKSTYPAIKGRAALAIKWDESAAETRGSDAMFAAYAERSKTPGTTAAKTGDVDAALATPGAQVVEAVYEFPYLAHAPMEPLGGFIEWDGTSARARFGSQIQTGDQGAIAGVLGVAPDKVAIDTVLAGGSFGRRAQPSCHLAAELAECAKAIGPGTPIRLTWTREDDIHGGHYRPLFVHRIKGAIKDGRIVAWSNSVVGQSFMIGSPFEAMVVRNGIDSTMIEGGSNPPYAFPAFRCDVTADKSPVSTLWWRSVGHTHTGYVVETFVDRLLVAAGKDPVAGRLEMMAAQPRAAGVLKAVAKLADWNGKAPPKGRAHGVAVVESFNSFVAQVAEVSVGTDGEPRVHKIWCAVDCGVAVNPDIIRAQIEGGVGYAVGHALYAEVPLVAGRATVSNFNDYRSLRGMEMPAVEVLIVASTEKPTGIGEPGVPPCAPAIANALAKLGRDRPTRLPMVRTA
ncbi:xanthine dehydrogenase family protein molybdopterin-binding subunit [Glacieibacterium frigidum]|uniref:Xanthine dehydrogenase family protein molybdopterin-binding subunit n=1 Tax=Glacieibacterium frigidum TaxID=2593303 RepID=A0A552UFV3_9SPHN|nr:molybdopterin cofactor-binding domain-containing protein [Glacieibacterium frigidum]TRW17106.1 xanthine dehydrogenase family protein molybdopterin-binding subunit [Glacieibacterium frigidum]